MCLLTPNLNHSHNLKYVVRQIRTTVTVMTAAFKDVTLCSLVEFDTLLLEDTALHPPTIRTNLGKLAMPSVMLPSDLSPSLPASSCFRFNAFSLSLRFSAASSSESMLSCVDITVGLFITQILVTTTLIVRVITMDNKQASASIL
jgi:hypothetical protein